MPSRRSRRVGRKRQSGIGLIGGSAHVNAGDGGGAADWVLKNFGTTDQQWMNTFGPNSLGTLTGNLLPTIQGAPAVLPGLSAQGINPPSQLIPFKFFGGKRGKKGKKSKRGGMGILTEAAVPLALLAVQQSYGSRKNGLSRFSRRGRRGTRRRR